MHLSSAHSPFKGFYLFFCGMCMGAADLVPGISGGTVAFIMGFYHPLLESLKTINSTTLKLLFTFQFRAFFQQVAWRFLVTLIGGISCSILLLASLFHSILEHEIYRMYFYSGFMGLILASFVFCLRQLKRWSLRELLGVLLGAVVAYALTDSTLSPGMIGPYAIKIEAAFATPLANYDVQQGLLTQLSKETLSALLAKGMIQPHTPVYDLQGAMLGIAAEFILPHRSVWMDGWLIACGVIAICALLLPGISGSYLLTLLGVYPLIMGALVDLMTGLKQFSIDSEAALILLSLLVGILIGAVCFARFVSWLIRSYPDPSLAILAGFMMGALRSVWPFWSYSYVLSPLKLYKGPQLLPLSPIWPPGDLSLLGNVGLCAMAGFLLVFFIESLAKRKVPAIAHSG